MTNTQKIVLGPGDPHAGYEVHAVSPVQLAEAQDSTRINSHDRLRIAAAAVVCERSVIRYLADPESVRDLTRVRIERAMVDLGLMSSAEAA